MSRRTRGLILAAVGVIVVVLAAAADVIGFSGEGFSDSFGRLQIIGTALGAVLIAGGLALVLVPKRPAPEPTLPAEDPTLESPPLPPERPPLQ